MRRHCCDFRKSKRAFIGDILTLMIVMFILAITILAGYLVLSNYTTQVQATTQMGTQAQTIVGNSTSRYTNLWDGLFMFLLIGLGLAAAISAYFVDTHPILFIFMLIVLAVYVVVAGAIANAYYDVEAASAMSEFALNFKMMHFVMNKLPYFVMIEGAVIFIALFAKVRQ